MAGLVAFAVASKLSAKTVRHSLLHPYIKVHMQEQTENHAIAPEQKLPVSGHLLAGPCILFLAMLSLIMEITIKHSMLKR